MRLFGAEPGPLRRLLPWLVAVLVVLLLAAAAAAANQPDTALKNALGLVFAAYQDPSDAKLRALSDAFSPAALDFERPEAEHLISGGLHLAGSTPPQVQIVSSTNRSPDTAEVQTHEQWTYDEVDAPNRPM